MAGLARIALAAGAALATCATCIGSAEGQSPARAEGAVRSCYLQAESLVADLDPAVVPDTSTLIFTVKGESKRTLFTELIPITGEAPLRVDVQPIDIDTIRNAKSVECRVVHVLGSSESASNLACRALVPVDMGIETAVNAVEITDNKVAARVTMKMVVLGALLIKNFNGEKLYLRDPTNGRHSLLTLSGPAPKTVFITMSALGAPDPVLELGVDGGTPLVTFCLST